LRIKPGPGKKITVTKPNDAQEQVSAQKEESLTPAEKAVKEEFEFRLDQMNREYSADIIYRNIHYKEVENDGYEALVIASFELRNDDKEWETRYIAVEAKLSGNNWLSGNTPGETGFYTTDHLRAWRDIKILGLKDFKLITEPVEGHCGGKPITNRAEALYEIENKGEKERTVELSFSLGYASDGTYIHVEAECSGAPQLNFGASENEIRIEPYTTKTYTISGEAVGRDSTGWSCCVYKNGNLSDELPTPEKIDGYSKPYGWWLKHPQYIP